MNMARIKCKKWNPTGLSRETQYEGYSSRVNYSHFYFVIF